MTRGPTDEERVNIDRMILVVDSDYMLNLLRKTGNSISAILDEPSETIMNSEILESRTIVSK